MKAFDVAAAADENLAAHFTWVQRQTAGMRSVLEDDLVRTECGMDCDTFNAVCRARLAPAGAARRIGEAIAWFSGRPFSWWVGPSDAPEDLGLRLEDAGLAAAETELAMAARLSALRAADEKPDGLEIRRVRDAVGAVGLRARQRRELDAAGSGRRALLRARGAAPARDRLADPSLCRLLRGRGRGGLGADGRGRRGRSLRDLDARAVPAEGFRNGHDAAAARRRARRRAWISPCSRHRPPAPASTGESDSRRSAASRSTSPQRKEGGCDHAPAHPVCAGTRSRVRCVTSR